MPLDTAEFAGAFWVMAAASLIGPFAALLLFWSGYRLLKYLRDALENDR